MPDNSENQVVSKPETGGYNPEDLIKAPLQPPTPADTEPKRYTNNKSVRFLMVVGISLAVVGFVLLFINVWVGLLIMLLGAATITADVFAVIH